MNAPASEAHGIDDLRSRLFGVLDTLTDPNKPVDVERTRAVVSIAEQIIDSAKVQVDYLRVVGEGTAGFLEPRKPAPALPPAASGDPMTAMTRQLAGGSKGAAR